MNPQRTLIAVSSALVFANLTGCMKKQPLAAYVNQNMTLNGYAQPGQVLEWWVSTPQSAPFKFKPEPNFCSKVKELATYGSPATCVVAPQSYPEGARMNVYSYELQSTEGTERYRASREKGSDGQLPAARNTSPRGVFAQRVGSCGPCSVVKKPPTSGERAPQLPVGPPNPTVTLICTNAQLTAQQNPQNAEVGSSITWYPSQEQLVLDWTIQFQNAAVCSPNTVNAGHDNCTIQNVAPGKYNYTAHLYKSTNHSSANLVCEGTASLDIQAP